MFSAYAELSPGGQDEVRIFMHGLAKTCHKCLVEKWQARSPRSRLRETRWGIRWKESRSVRIVRWDFRSMWRLLVGILLGGGRPAVFLLGGAPPAARTAILSKTAAPSPNPSETRRTKPDSRHIHPTKPDSRRAVDNRAWCGGARRGWRSVGEARWASCFVWRRSAGMALGGGALGGNRA